MRRRNSPQVEPTVAMRFPSLSQGPELHLQAHMFVEDITMAIMPIGGRTSNQKDFAVSLEGENGECEKAKQILGELCEFEKYDLSEMACDAVGTIARRLTWEGRAVYEILSNEKKVHLFSFTSKRLFRIPKYFLQFTPRKDWELLEKKLVVVPSNRIWQLEIPPVLGGRAKYLRVLQELRRFSHTGPDFWRDDLQRGMQTQHFDFQKYRRKAEIHCRRVTKKWGWNSRDLSQDRATEFYTFYKMITFHWAQAILREYITKEINGLFSRLHVCAELKIRGLPTPTEILEVRRELRHGSITFAAASDRVTL